jgi:hypothetical protein
MKIYSGEEGEVWESLLAGDDSASVESPHLLFLKDLV